MSESLIDRLAVAIHLGTSTGARGNHPSNIYNLAQEALDALRAASLSTEPMAQEGGEVSDWRHRCAVSNMHDHDGCACTAAELRARYAPSPAPAQQEGGEPAMSHGWLIYKVGRGWYRPNAQGYTNNASEAGRYSREEANAYSRPDGWAGPRDEISIKHESELPATSPVAPFEEVTVERIENIIAHRIDLGSTPRSIAEQVFAALQTRSKQP